MSKVRRMKGIGITKKLLMTVTLLTIVVCVVSTVSGYRQYSNTIRKLYNDNGYVIGQVILDNIDHDKVARYAATWTEDEDYDGILEYLRGVREASDAAYIYIVTAFEDGTVKYVFDTYETTVIGDEAKASSHFDEVWAAYTKGTKPKSYIVRKSPSYGYLTSSILPIRDSSGKIVALLFVDVWMKDIMSTLHAYIVKMALISVIALALFAVAYWYFMRRSFIGPLMRIRGNVIEFAENDTVTETSLKDIKTNDEIQELAESVDLMEGDIIKYIESIRTISAEKERIGAELNIATKIQADMLPRIFPPFPERKEFDIYATMDPAKEVGGDFYDFYFIDEDHMCMVMADVSGKGVPAALFMVIAKALIKSRAQLGESPSEILYNVNNQLCDGNEAEMFVTVWLGIVQISTGKGVAANAGHEHPVIRRADGKYELVVYRHSPAVAAMEGLRFREHEFELNPGDSLFVYTDGVPEATNANNELFGTERMLEVLNSEPEAKPEQLLKNVRSAIDGFVGDAPQFDDITMLDFQYRGTQQAPGEN